MKNKKIKAILQNEWLRILISLLLFVFAVILELLNIKEIALITYVFALLCAGFKVFCDAVKGLLRLDPLDEKFLMSIASIGAMIVGEWSEGVAVMIFYLVGESFEHRAVRKARASIKALMDICPDEACVIIDGVEQTVDAEDVSVGATIVIRPGERVAVDCTVISGRADVDTSAMTGEPLPISVSSGELLLSGYVVKDGLIYAKAERPAEESSAARVLELVEYASDNKSREESFITRFSRYYTPVVVLMALAVATLPVIFGVSGLEKAVYTALTFLVISCPCALVISVPMAFFGGIGGAASRGILFKGGNVFSKVAKTETVAFDKTGTITSGRFEIRDAIPIGVTKEELLFIAASVEYSSNHPIAESLRSLSTKAEKPKEAKELSGLGVVATVGNDTCAVGNLALMEREGISVPREFVKTGAIYVSKNSSLVGSIYVSDSIKEEAKNALSQLYKLGVRSTAILSGDRAENVIRVGEEIGIKEVYFELAPEDKYKKLEELIKNSQSTMFVGDGINDAPSLARADVGVAMGNIGQDSAIEASDVVIMTDNLTKLPEAIKIARKTVRIARENIVFAIGTKALILILGSVGFANMWLAVFADVGVAVLAVLNSMRALKYKKQ